MKASNFTSNQNSEDLDSTEDKSLPPLLPRSGWNSRISYLREIFKAKRALDRIEQEADINYQK